MNNEKISKRQLFYLTSLELFSIVTLFLPEFLSNNLNQDATIGLLTGFLFAFVFVFLLKIFFEKYGNKILCRFGEKGILIEALAFVFLIQTVLLTVFIVNMCEEIVEQFLLPNAGRIPVLVSFYVICVIASMKKVEVRARMAEFSGRFFAVIFTILLLFAVRRVDLNQYETLFMNTGKKIINGGYEVFILLQSVFFSLFAALNLNDRKCYGNTVKKSLMFCLIFSLALMMILIGTFGTNYIGVMDYPAIRLLRNITQSGGFLSRMDVLMIAVWLFSMFFLVSGGLQYGKMLLSSVLGENSEKSVGLLIYIIVFMLTLIWGNKDNSYYVYRNYSYYIGTPLIVVLLLLAVLLPCTKNSRNSASIVKKRKVAKNEK